MLSALVIDDNRQMADSLCQMLELLGITAEAAYGARTGILTFTKKIPSMVFLDINMPSVDGFEVLGYLRRQPVLENTPVIVVTSDDQPETAKRSREMGAVAIILKPVTVELLEKSLKEVKLI